MSAYVLLSGDAWGPSSLEGVFTTPEAADRAGESLGHDDWWVEQSALDVPKQRPKRARRLGPLTLAEERRLASIRGMGDFFKALYPPDRLMELARRGDS